MTGNLIGAFTAMRRPWRDRSAFYALAPVPGLASIEGVMDDTLRAVAIELTSMQYERIPPSSPAVTGLTALAGSVVTP